MLERLPRLRRWLRRASIGRECPIHTPDRISCCDASTPLDEIDYGGEIIYPFDWPRDDPRWPKRCAACGYVFVDSDYWHVSCAWVFRRVDTGEHLLTRDAPPGAIWNCGWYPEAWTGPDGLSLMAKLPNGLEWPIDGDRKSTR